MTRHATRRAFTRLGIVLGDAEKAQLMDKVREGRAKRLQVQRDGREAWRIKWRGRRLVVICNPSDGGVITVLPTEAWLPEEFERV